MPFSYHAPTRLYCEVCEALPDASVAPIINAHNGKASSANNYPFHNWYNFVLGYAPDFPDYMLTREKATPHDLVADPFMGSGTTLICCKNRGIPSIGIDANNFIVDAARTKVQWAVDVSALRVASREILQRVDSAFGVIHWDDMTTPALNRQLSLFDIAAEDRQSDRHFVDGRRPEMLQARYISDKPFAKARIIADIIHSATLDDLFRRFFELALTSIIVPISNIKYEPCFGVAAPKNDVDVYAMFAAKLYRMLTDLEGAHAEQRATPSSVVLGDARTVSRYIAPDSVSLMITSPPYPGDHEYTKHTRLELLFKGYATTLDDLRVIKKRMIRASTTNIFNTDNDRLAVADVESIQRITALIDARLKNDGATSGFEKLYTKLIWEYFGGMYKALEECYRVLKPGGKIALLVSESHAFKMVHVQTVRILQEIGEHIGFVNAEIVLWQKKTSTSHTYTLREEILILSKPL